MSLESLTAEQIEIVRRALAFVASTRHLDGEFETRMGVDRRELAEVLMRWPSVNDRVDRSPARIAVNNALNEVVNGLVLSVEEWRGLGVTRAQVDAAYHAWASARGGKSTGPT